MERTEFVGADEQSWWLYDVPTDIRIEEARRELGAALGWTETAWFAEPNRRQALFDFLQGNGYQLLVDLDTVADDEGRLQWVLAVKKLAVPPQPVAARDQPAEARKPNQVPVRTEQKAAPAAAPAKKKSIFKAKAASDAAAASGSQATAARGDGETPGRDGLENATQAVLSDLAGSGLADLARELGAEPADLEAIVHTPNFERQVREEVARIVTV